MATLTEPEIRQIQIYLDLSRKQLFPNSELRWRIKTIAQDDARYGLTIIQDIKEILTAIADLDAKIKTIKTDNNNAIRQVDIDGEYRVEYQENQDSASGLRELRDNLIYRLNTDLDLYTIQTSGRLLRS